MEFEYRTELNPTWRKVIHPDSVKSLTTIISEQFPLMTIYSKKNVDTYWSLQYRIKPNQDEKSTTSSKPTTFETHLDNIKYNNVCDNNCVYCKYELKQVLESEFTGPRKSAPIIEENMDVVENCIFQYLVDYPQKKNISIDNGDGTHAIYFVEIKNKQPILMIKKYGYDSNGWEEVESPYTEEYLLIYEYLKTAPQDTALWQSPPETTDSISIGFKLKYK